MKKKTKSKSPIQIIAAIGLVIAILWTAKGFFQLGGAVLKKTENTSTSSTTEAPANMVNINCSFVNGHAIIQGDMINVPKGFKGTHNIAITLDTTNNKIEKFDELLGLIYAINTQWSDTKIYWRWVMDKNSSTYTYTDYHLNRSSGELTVLFESKISKYGSSAYTYNCNKSSQKF